MSWLVMTCNSRVMCTGTEEREDSYDELFDTKDGLDDNQEELGGQE